MFGMHHHRHVSKDGSTGKDGTNLDVHAIKQLVTTAAKQVHDTPTCLHDVRFPPTTGRGRTASASTANTNTTR
jgi:hypothetical protein